MSKPTSKSKAKKIIRRFSVLLRYPDYITGNWPDDHYYCWVKATSAVTAITAARRKACRAQKETKANFPTDFQLIGVWRDHIWMEMGPHDE